MENIRAVPIPNPRFCGTLFFALFGENIATSQVSVPSNVFGNPLRVCSDASVDWSPYHQLQNEPQCKLITPHLAIAQNVKQGTLKVPDFRVILIRFSVVCFTFWAIAR